MPSRRYREKNDVHVPVIDWLKSSKRYREFHGDPEALGARVDSVGVLDGMPTAIEFKVVMSGGDIAFRQNGGSSIEAKLSETLRNVYGGMDDLVSNELRSAGGGAVPVHFILAASNYSETALQALEEMFGSRSFEWGFSYEVWKWAGGNVEVLIKGGSEVRAGWAGSDGSSIPVQVPYSKPRKKLGRDQFREALGSERFELLDGIFMAAEDRGMKLSYNGWRCELKGKGHPPVTLYASRKALIYPGVVIGIDRLPGCADPSFSNNKIDGMGIGHRDIMRTVLSPAEFETLLSDCGY